MFVGQKPSQLEYFFHSFFHSVLSSFFLTLCYVHCFIVLLVHFFILFHRFLEATAFACKIALMRSSLLSLLGNQFILQVLLFRMESILICFRFYVFALFCQTVTLHRVNQHSQGRMMSNSATNRSLCSALYGNPSVLLGNPYLPPSGAGHNGTSSPHRRDSVDNSSW